MKRTITLDLTDEQFEELQKQFGKKKSRTPNGGDRYWCIERNGGIEDSTWNNDIIDKGRLSIGNIFLTKEEAQAEVDKRLALQRIKTFIAEQGLDQDVDWEDVEWKYIIYFDYSYKRFIVTSFMWTHHHSPFGYFSKQKEAQLVIDNCSEDLKVVWGVKE